MWCWKCTARNIQFEQTSTCSEKFVFSACFPLSAGPGALMWTSWSWSGLGRMLMKMMKMMQRCSTWSHRVCRRATNRRRLTETPHHEAAGGQSNTNPDYRYFSQMFGLDKVLLITPLNPLLQIVSRQEYLRYFLLLCFTQNCILKSQICEDQVLNDGVKKLWEKSKIKLNTSINNDVGLINQMEC